MDLPPWVTALEPLGLRSGDRVDLLYVHLPLSSDFGADDQLDRALEAMEAAGVELLRPSSTCAVFRVAAEDLLFACSHLEGDVEDHLSNLDRRLNTTLSSLIDALPGVPPRAAACCLAHTSLAVDEPALLQRPMARAVKHIQLECWRPEAAARNTDGRLLANALATEAFEYHFQPIVDVQAGAVIAYEALCRGTMQDFRFPDLIFKTAERCDRVWDLGKVLRDVAARATASLHESSKGGRMMFLNVHPRDLNDPSFIQQTTDGPLVEFASEIVLELTERAAVDDYKSLKKLFGTLRAHGYRVAIDDLGSGYAGLTALAELEPEFIKFDMGLVRDLHLNPTKQQLIERMVGFARDMQATTISEGVECAEERAALLNCGSNVMQGYFFARPAPSFVELHPSAVSGHAA